MTARRSPETSSTVSHALGVLGQLLVTPQFRFSDLLSRTQLSRAALARILNTLLAKDFLLRDPDTGLYSCGPKLLSLAATTVSSFDVVRRATPVMRHIAKETAETVSLIVPVDLRGVCIEQVCPERELRFVNTLGRPAPLHAGASRKVLLAFLPEEIVERVLSAPLDRVTDRTITDANQLRRQLAQIRKSGYAISHGEHIEGVSGIAVPIWAPDGQVAASLSVAGPSTRLSEHMLREKCLPLLREGAARIGYSKRPPLLGPHVTSTDAGLMPHAGTRLGSGIPAPGRHRTPGGLPMSSKAERLGNGV